ncbi:Panacea domain-containing protein [Capnocytophaga cynodegmi]|uniref:Panacea domain-containing protein n=1 Tax=Capnocytophaga cynodegmi TaxID=28189 RepID=UPI00385B4CFA
METRAYVKFSDSQFEKIGNTMVYLTKKIGGISKTKLLKLLYILDEISIKKSGIPFLNLTYKVWKFGPVSEELFIDLSSKNEIGKLKKYLKNRDDKFYPIVAFNDDEFSENDIELMDFVISKYGHKTANQLVNYTHRETGLWHQTAKNNGVLELLENEIINSTEFVIDMKKLVEHEPKKQEMYLDYLEFHS